MSIGNTTEYRERERERQRDKERKKERERNREREGWAEEEERETENRKRANEQWGGVGWGCTLSYLQTLQVRLRHGTLAVSGFTALLEIASKLAACDTLRDGPSAPPAAEKFAPSQIPDFWDTWKTTDERKTGGEKRREEKKRE